MSHFLMPFYGNKIKEYKYLEPFLDFNGVENIIEPFCGSSAISFNIWLKHPHLNFYLNDIDLDLINHYNLLKNNDINEIYDTINQYKIQYNKPDEYKEFAKSAINETPIDPFKYIFMKKVSRFRYITLERKNHNKTNYFPKLTNLKLKFIEFVKSPNVFISNDDWSVLFNQYKNDTNTMFFFDPPYIDCDNRFYNKKERRDVYDDTVYRYFNENKITTFNSKIFVILELIEKNIEIFGEENIINTYDKDYRLSKKKTKHAIFSNLNTLHKNNL